MRAALVEAEGALNRWEVPVGCVIVRDGEVVATGSNRTNELRNVRLVLLITPPETEKTKTQSPRLLLPTRIPRSTHFPLGTRASRSSDEAETIKIIRPLTQGTRHAEFEAIDSLLERHGQDPEAAGEEKKHRKFLVIPLYELIPPYFSHLLYKNATSFCRRL